MKRADAEVLKEKYDKDLADLQEHCPHTETRVLPYMWRPGAFGRPKRTCNNCWKEFPVTDEEANKCMDDYYGGLK